MIRIKILLSRLITKFYYKYKFKNIGRGTYIDGNHRISGYNRISIGNCCVLDKNLRMEAITQYSNETFSPELIIGDNVIINQNFHCTCAERVIIGKGTSITANCGVFDIIHPYQDINENPRFSKILTKPVEIGEDCMIGMNSVILPGTTLGKHCVVGANSTVSGTFTDYCIIAGSPARVIKRYDLEKGQWIRV